MKDFSRECSMTEPKDDNWNKNRDSRLSWVVIAVAMLTQIAVLVMLWRHQHLVGIIGILLAIGYLLLFFACLFGKGTVRSGMLVWYFLIRLGLFIHLFGSNIVAIIASLVVTRAFLFVVRLAVTGVEP